MSGNSAQVPPGPPDDYHPPLPPFQGAIEFPPYVPRPPASVTRTAAGLFAACLGLDEFVHFIPTWFVATTTGSGSFALLAALFLMAALANLTIGVILVATRRSRRRKVPILAAGFATFAILLSLADAVSVGYSPDILFASLAATLVPAVAVLVLIGAALAHEKAEAFR